MSDSNHIKVLAVREDDETRRIVRLLFSEFSDLSLIAETDRPSEALMWLGGQPIDVALVDLRLKDSDGISLIQQIREKHPSVRVVVTTASDEVEDIFSAMDAGADAYILKSNLGEALESAIRSVSLRTVWLDPALAKQVLNVIQTASTSRPGRVLPTGLIKIPLMPEEKSLLSEIAGSQCKDGVCSIDPAFLRKLRHFAPAAR